MARENYYVVWCFEIEQGTQVQIHSILLELFVVKFAELGRKELWKKFEWIEK